MNRQKLPYDPALLAKRAESIITNVRELAQRGWTPATSSNFSQRLDHAHAAITVSGRDKGRLVEDDIMVVDFDGRAVGRPLRPSAETLLHTHDITQGLDVPWEPPADLCAKVLGRLFPGAPPGDPARVLLWATGRGELDGHPRQTSWRWYAALPEGGGS